jgi:hypothetical protein
VPGSAIKIQAEFACRGIEEDGASPCLKPK